MGGGWEDTMQKWYDWRGTTRYEEEGRGRNARERTIIARTKQFLERSRSVKVQVEALEASLGTEDVDVDLR